MSYVENPTDFTVLYSTVDNKPLNSVGQPASNFTEVQFYEGGYKVRGQSQQEIDQDLSDNSIIELDAFKAELPVDFDNLTHKSERFFLVDIPAKKYTQGMRAVALTQQEIDDRQADQNKRDRRQTAQNILDGIDADNMTSTDRTNALRALVILNQNL